MKTEFAIELESLKFGYGKKIEKNEIIHSISTQIPSEKITVIAGPNGSGKSTLLKLLVGIEKKWDGNIKFNIQNEKELAKIISFVPQSRKTPETTVERLVLAGRFPHTRFPNNYKKEDIEIAHKSMKKMGIFNMAQKELSELSGGQRQKVYISMAISQSTPILILDEPLTFLDIRQQLELIETLKNLKSEKKTIILVVHDLNLALTIADNMILMEQGRVIAQGNPAKIAEFGFIDKVFGVQTKKIDSDFGNKYFFTV